MIRHVFQGRRAIVIILLLNHLLSVLRLHFQINFRPLSYPDDKL
jgi:hypothetical protein